MKKLFILSMAVLAVSVPVARAADAPATAKTSAGHGQRYFDRLDANHDGVVTKDEFMKAHEDRFSKMDANGDGKISRDEAQKSADQWHAKMKAHKTEAGKATTSDAPAQGDAAAQ